LSRGVAVELSRQHRNKGECQHFLWPCSF
jgi:hypothetical protein